MKRITLEEIRQRKKIEDYNELYDWIMKQIKSGSIKPVKASGTNGKRPSLHLAYWMADENNSQHNEELIRELKFSLIPLISNDYYLAHLDVYREERKWVLMLNTFLRDHRDALDEAESVNERSFEIWGREKFLKEEGGRRILKHCGILPERLMVYDTCEPMACYCHTRETPQNILILENKDTFYSMRRCLMEGNNKILGTETGTLIYGAGKGILKSFQDFSVCAEPYMRRRENRLLYFGDLDYEGIGIYERLAGMFYGIHEIQPFIPGYEAMIRKAVFCDYLPETSENQNRNITTLFFSYFSDIQVEHMKAVLEAGRYIPQEILNRRDFQEIDILIRKSGE